MTHEGRPTADLATSALEPLVARSLLRRLGVSPIGPLGERVVWAAFMFVNGFVTMAMLGAVAMFTGTPFIFPSLGPTAFLVFVTPMLPTASPRNILYGHALGIACGYGSLWLCGLTEAPAALSAGVDVARVVAAALSLASTGALMVLLKASHPPAGATTLIVSLGLVTKPPDLAIVGLAVGLLTVQAIAINRLAGIDYPLWRVPRSGRH